jgi:hypothetical protein
MSHHSPGPDWGFPRGDARMDLTDRYVFPKPGDASKSILIMNMHPSARDFLDRENPLGPTTVALLKASRRNTAGTGRPPTRARLLRVAVPSRS